MPWRQRLWNYDVTNLYVHRWAELSFVQRLLNGSLINMVKSVHPGYSMGSTHLKQDKQRRIASDAWQDNDYVFCAHDGTYLSPNHVSSYQLKQLLKAADLPDIRFHDLRHGAATLLLSLQVHPKVVQEILRHSDISTTMNIYSHVLPSMQVDAMKQLHSAFKQDDLDKGK